MSFRSNTAPFARRLFIIASALSALTSLRAEPAAQPLEPYVTTATRTPAAPQTLGSAVEAISAIDLERQQRSSLADALGASPGVPVVNSGGAGGATSVFLRGANSNQTLFLVDGIRLNDPNTDYQVMLGGAALGAGDSIEIARGPQSTLYGADAIGGVVAIRSARGTGPASSCIAVEGGSFGSIAGAAATQGSSGRSAWNVSLRGAHTDNERPNNEFDSTHLNLRLDRTVAEGAEIGTTVRWYHGKFGSPGDRYTDDPNNREAESNLLATAFADLKFGGAWTAKVILGGQQRRYVYDTPAPNPPWGSPAARTDITNRRGVIDAQATFVGVDRHRVTFSANAELQYTRNTGFGDIDEHQRLFAVFAQDEISLTDNLYVTAGVRHDDFDTFGEKTTGRGTLAWLPLPRVLKLRASYGTGFRSPSFLELYGRNAYYVGNPDVVPERSRGVDAGFDWYIAGGASVLSATWFQTDFNDLITYDFAVFPSTVYNVGKARTQGAEVAFRSKFGGTHATVSYTYLDARALNPTGHTRLLRRPDHQIAFDLNRDFGSVTAGVGARYLGRRADVDAQTFATITQPGVAVARVYAAWHASEALTLKARIENALDREYEVVNGYPTLGLAAFAGVEWRF